MERMGRLNPTTGKPAQAPFALVKHRSLRQCAMVLDCWDVAPDISLAELASLCLAYRDVDRLMVTARSALSSPDTLDEPRVKSAVAKLFGEVLLESFWASAWPGTALSNSASMIYVITFDASVATRMSDTEDRLPAWNQWHQPPLPADVCLYRSGDRWPTLVSVTHEGEGWFGAWLYDEAVAAAIGARLSKLPLPEDLVPARSDFVVRQRTSMRTRTSGWRR